MTQTCHSTVILANDDSGMSVVSSLPRPALSVREISKSFGETSARRLVLDRLSLDIQPGERIALLGASGSGKSTLMRCLNGLNVIDSGSGEILVFGETLQSRGRLAGNIRDLRESIATIFQQFNLVGRLTVQTNVMVGAIHRLPLWRTLTGQFPDEVRLAALEALDRVAIIEQAYKRARLLSGGQQQRVAIARAIVQEARIVLADEPIASLDPESSRRVMELLVDLNESLGCTVVVSLHQVDAALKYFPRIVALRGGSIVYDGPSSGLNPAVLRDLYGSDTNLDFSAVASP